jgi:hypothetical protein
MASVEYPSAGILTTDQELIPTLDRQIAKCNRASRDLKDPQIEVAGISMDRDPALVPTEDAQRLVHQQFAAGKHDVALDGKSDRAIHGHIGDRLAQRTRTGIGKVCDNNIDRSEMCWSRERKKQRN